MVAKLKAMPEYQKEFMEVFGHAPNYDDIARAIAAFERTQVAFDSPFDKFMAGDQRRSAISRSADGRSSTARAAACRVTDGIPTQPMFSDNRFHNIGVSAHNKDFVPLARKALDTLAQRRRRRQQIDQLAIRTDMSESRPLPRHQAAARYRRVPHHGPAQLAGHRSRISTTARRRRCGTPSIITTRAACRIRSSTAESCRSG